MPRRRQSSDDDFSSRARPATTPEDREAQMIDLADQEAERQIRAGTASSQLLTHYLKLGSSRERLEQEKIRLEQELLRAKADQIAQMAKQEELFAEAIKAMRVYQGQEEEPQPYEGDYDE